MQPEHTELDAGLWLTITELAERKGVRKSTISEKVSRLIEAGRLTTKPGKGKAKLVNVAQYDLAVGEVGDAAREIGAETKAGQSAPAAASDPSRPRLRDAQTREKEYDADLKYIQLQKELGLYIPVADLDAAAEEAAMKTVEILDSLQAHETDLATIAIKEGENGVRNALKRIIRTQREQIVEAFKQMAANARKITPVIAEFPPIAAELPLETPVE